MRPASAAELLVRIADLEAENAELRTRIATLEAIERAWLSLPTPLRPRDPKSTLLDGGREPNDTTPEPAAADCLKCGWAGPSSATYGYPSTTSDRYHMGCNYAIVPVSEPVVPVSKRP